MGEVREIICSCGGRAREVETTPQEDKGHGCGRKRCCVQAFECDGCRTRWTITFEPPELDY